MLEGACLRHVHANACFCSEDAHKLNLAQTLCAVLVQNVVGRQESVSGLQSNDTPLQRYT